MLMLRIILSLVLTTSFTATTALTQDSQPKGGEPGWQPPKKASFSPKEVKTECRKFNRKYIGYYGKVYQVENCKRRQLVDSEVKRIMKRGVKVLEVEPSTIIKIPAGAPLESLAKERSCRQLEGLYILSLGGDMFYIKNCRKSLFPDWETYVAHSKKAGVKKVYELTQTEFTKLKDGPTMPSVIDRELQQHRVTETEVDLIPLDEACKGINGRYVSYYSKVYKIDSCRKREVLDPQKIIRKRSSKLIEISSEQWLSLPSGRNI